MSTKTRISTFCRKNISVAIYAFWGKILNFNFYLCKKFDISQLWVQRLLKPYWRHSREHRLSLSVTPLWLLSTSCCFFSKTPRHRHVALSLDTIGSGKVWLPNSLGQQEFLPIYLFPGRKFLLQNSDEEMWRTFPNQNPFWTMREQSQKLILSNIEYILTWAAFVTRFLMVSPLKGCWADQQESESGTLWFGKSGLSIKTIAPTNFNCSKTWFLLIFFQNCLFLEETKRKLSTYLSDAPLLACMAGIVR